MENEFTKDFFQRAWGAEGYYENFSYGVGIEKVCAVALYPFLDKTKHVLEIGPGAGAFTERITPRVDRLTAIDVIKQPQRFLAFDNLSYIEQQDKGYDCQGVADSSIDFCFCYNVFCHLPESAIARYLQSVHRVLKPGCPFVFMLADFEHSRKGFEGTAHTYKRNDLLPTLHFYQDRTTIDYILGKGQWELVSPSMIPEHRDRIIHLQSQC